ncbi:MAG: hypothetical protein M0Z31_08320 [Clostridia bacterium]|nr:hypothetical protein [Clostridia bacterium]
MRFYRLSILILLSILLTGCGPSGEEKNIQTVIRKYNNNLPIALESQNTTILEGLATEKELGRVLIFTSVMKKENKIVQAKMEKLEFVDINIEKVVEKGTKPRNPLDIGGLPKAKAKTKEVWSFQYLDVNTKKPLDKVQKLKYDATFTLVKQNDQWLVHSIEFKEELVQ